MSSLVNGNGNIYTLYLQDCQWDKTQTNQSEPMIPRTKIQIVGGKEYFTFITYMFIFENVCAMLVPILMY